MDENSSTNEGGSIPVRVAVRIRPMVESEILKGSLETVSVVPGTGQVCAGKDKSYTFDFAYDELSSQEEIYSSCIQSLVKGFFQGYNATVFAYGQTGSGKTYTMGTSDDYNSLGENQVGIIPRVVNDIFSRIEAEKQIHPNKNIKIETSFLEIHKEIIHDLFAPDPTQTNLAIREGADGDITVPGLTTVSIGSVEEFLYEMHKGSIHRSTASTNMNEQSSRSHAICTIIIHIEDDDSEEGSVSAKFHLVDLAGSESVKKTGAEGDTFKEGISINCGLLALGNVISALCDERNNNSNSNNNNHIPYRVSKLTRLLQDSLGGNSRTVMIACVSPADMNYSETLNTLRYADRARQIKNKPIINKESDSAEANRLRQKVKELQYELAVLKNGGNIKSNNNFNNNNNSKNNEIIDTMKLAIATLEQKNKVAETELCMLRKTNQRLKIENSQLKQDTFEINKERDEIMLLLQKNHIPFDISGVSEEISVVEARLKEIEELKSEIIMLRSNATGNINLDDDIDLDMDDMDENEIYNNNNNEQEEFEEDPSQIDPTIESRSKFKELTEQLNEKIKALQQTTSQCESIENIKEKNKEAIRKIEQLTKEKKELMLKIEQLKQKSEGKESLQKHLMKLKELESQIKEYEKKERYYKQLEIKRMRDANTIQKLEREIQEIKQQRVNLQKQIKEESKKWREDIKKYEKQIVQMKKEERKQQLQNMKSQNMAQKVQSKLERQLQERDTKISKLLLQINNKNQARSMNDAMRKKIDLTWLKKGYDILIKRESDSIQLERAKNSKKALLVQKKYIMRTIKPTEVFDKLQSINDEIIYCETEIKELNERLNENNKFDRKKLWDNLHTLQESLRALDYLLDICVQSGVNAINLTDQIEELKKIQKSSNEEFAQNNELLNCMLSIHENGVGDDLNKSTEVMIPLIQNQLNVYAEKVKILSNENSNLKERMNCLMNKSDDENSNKPIVTPLFQKIKKINESNNNNNNEEDLDTPTILRVANELNDDDLGELNVEEEENDDMENTSNNNNNEDEEEYDDNDDDDEYTDNITNTSHNNNKEKEKEKSKRKTKKTAEQKDEISLLLTGKGCYCTETSTCGTSRCFCNKFNKKCGPDCKCCEGKCKNREKENLPPEIKIENYLRECEKKNDVKMTFRQPSKSFTQKSTRKSLTGILTQRKLSNHNSSSSINDSSCPKSLIDEINNYVDKVASKRENKLPVVDEIDEEENKRDSTKRKSNEGDDEKKSVPKKVRKLYRSSKIFN